MGFGLTQWLWKPETYSLFTFVETKRSTSRILFWLVSCNGGLFAKKLPLRDTKTIPS